MEWNNVTTSFCYRPETIRPMTGRLVGFVTGGDLVLSCGNIACFVPERMENAAGGTARRVVFK